MTAAARRAPLPKLRTPLVLVVDDTTDVRETIDELLRDHGYATAAASDGQEALDLLHAGLLPDVILLDLMMVGTDGTRFRDAQLLDATLAGIPVVLMTALRPVGVGVLEGNRVLLKPFRIEQLLAEIEKAAERFEPKGVRAQAGGRS